jgi:hypothetical protein
MRLTEPPTIATPKTCSLTFFVAAGVAVLLIG